LILLKEKFTKAGYWKKIKLEDKN